MKNKVINAAVCDARNVTEEALAGFENITINASVLITGERSRELMNRYPVTTNAASIIDVPEDQDIAVKCNNGSYEIGPDADGTGTLLIVNGKLTAAAGSLEAVKSYYKIMVNGKALIPESLKGQSRNITVNGKTEYYPDGAVILKKSTEIDDLFITRAANSLYWCPGTLFFLDGEMDAEKLLGKGIRFAAGKIVITKSLLNVLLPQFDEEAEIIYVPDGTILINDDLELKPKTIKKYGTKLCVSGDVSICDAEALSAMEYLYAGGTVRIDKDLEETFDEIESVYSELKLIDPSAGYISDRPAVKVGRSTVEKYRGGLTIEDCARVILSEDLTPELITNKLRITDCAVVCCTKEQEEAVNMIAEDVAMIMVSGEEEDDRNGWSFGNFFKKLKDTQMINAAEYKL